MKKISVVLAIILTFFATSSFAANESQQRIQEVKTDLKASFPQLAFNQIAPTPVKGVYEVISGENVIYYAPDSDILFFGELWTKEEKNLTQETKDRLVREKLARLPLDRAVKIGNGPKVVIEVTDPDCGYCRKGSDFLDTVEDQVTRYIFFFPLEQVHPDAAAKCEYILSARDQVRAYKEVMSGKYDKKPLPAFTDKGRLAIHKEVSNELGLRGTPAYWIDGTAVSGANIPAMKKLLSH